MLGLQLETGLIERRLGFRRVRSLAGTGGQERFGVVELAGGGLAAALALRGRNLWLAEPEEMTGVCRRLAAALPDYPLQFLLTRRRASLMGLTSLWREQAVRLVSPAPGAAEWLLRGLKEGLLPRLERAGVVEVGYAVVVAAGDADLLVERVAELFTRLPFDPLPLTAAELTALCARLLRPGDQITAGIGGPGHLELAAPQLELGGDQLSLSPQTLTSYWQVAPPFPSAPGGWAWRLLEFPELQSYEYDLAVHVRPTGDEAGMRQVLAGRLARLEASGTHEGAREGTARSDPSLREMELRELRQRLAGLSSRTAGLREVTALLALHAPAGEVRGRGAGGSGQGAFAGLAGSLERAEIVARRVTGRSGLVQALRATMPLARAGNLRSHTVPLWHAAEVALLPAGEGQSVEEGPVIGVSREMTLFRGTAADGSQGNILLAGGTAAARRAVAARLALQALLAGERLLGFDPGGEWAGWVEAAGGRYARPGGGRPADRLDLLAAPLEHLNRPEFFETWVRELSALFGLLLSSAEGQDREVVEGQVGAALLQTAMRCLEAGEGTLLTLQAIYDELHAGGDEATAGAISRLIDGPAAGLFEPAPAGSPSGSALFVGPPGDGLDPAAGRLAAQLAARRLVWGAAPAGPGARILLARPAALLEHAEAAADLLAMAARRDGAAHSIWLLLGEDELQPLLAHPAGPGLLDRSFTRVIFSPAASLAAEALKGKVGLPAAYTRLGRALGLSGSLMAQINLLDSKEALVSGAGRASVIDLVCD